MSSSSSSENVGIALALVFGAGAATAIGAGVVFFPTLVKYANRRTLASALGLSAGVMTYVSFIEIFQKSITAFEDAEYDENNAYTYGTLCFFAGVVLMVALNYCVTKLLRGEHHHHHSSPSDLQKESITQSISRTSGNNDNDNNNNNKNIDNDEVVAPCACCSDDPVRDLKVVQDMARTLDGENNNNKHKTDDNNEHCPNEDNRSGDCCQDSECCDGKCCVVDDDDKDECRRGESNKNGEDEEEDEDNNVVDNNAVGDNDDEHEDAKLMQMSINTAIAIALHNFPEGLATFVATLHDPKVGAVLAVAIAIHNIPEGLCVAMPIYYATGKRWKAFCWGVISGVSEPIAALLGWAVLANSFSDTLYGILFGIVAGMMVIISARDLLPTAHRYDPEDTVVTFSFIGGMVIMALSLVLFAI